MYRRRKTRYWQQPRLESQFELARRTTAEYARSFYLATQFLPRYKRWATYAVYGFCRYADNIVDIPRSRSYVEVRDELDAVEYELSRAYRSGESEHPVISPFIAAAREFHIPQQYARELLIGVTMDLEFHRYGNFGELYLFCYRVASVVGLMMTHILGFRSDKTLEYAEKLGIAMQLTNILRDVKEDKDMGRIYLPQDEMKEYGIGDDDIIQERYGTDLAALMRFQVNRAREYYRQADRGIPMLDRDAQFAIRSASRIYGGILNKLEDRNFNPFPGRVYLSSREKLGIVVEELIGDRSQALKQFFAGKRNARTT